MSQPTAQALFLLGVTQVEQPIKHAPKKGTGQPVRSPAGTGAWCSPAQAMAECWLLPLACLAASLLPAARSTRSGQGEASGGAAVPAPIPPEDWLAALSPRAGECRELELVWVPVILLEYSSPPAFEIDTGSVGAS